MQSGRALLLVHPLRTRLHHFGEVLTEKKTRENSFTRCFEGFKK
jgi:hypothetical protein